MTKINLLADYYKSGTYKFEVEKIAVKEDRAVIWANAQELLEAVLEERNVIGNYSVKLMADGGQGFFKVSMLIFFENDHSGSFNSCKNFENEQETRRSLYRNGGIAGKAKKLRGYLLTFFTKKHYNSILIFNVS